MSTGELACPYCDRVLKRVQIEADRDSGVINVRINWSFTKEDALKQAKGLEQLIKQFAEGLESK